MRRMRFFAWWLVGGTSALGIAVAAGCAPAADSEASVDTSESAAAQVRGIDLTAELDPDRGAVILPYDRFLPTTNEEGVIATAGSHLNAKCAAGEGVNFISPSLLQDPIYDSELFFGPWTAVQAERFGFVNPMTDADLIANGYLPQPSDASPNEELAAQIATNSQLTDADWDVVGVCSGRDEVKGLANTLSVSNGPWGQPLSETTADSIFDEPQAKAALDDLNSCFSQEGMEGDPDNPGYPVGADPSILTEDQITLALATVQCKDSVDFTRRVADVIAEKQAPIIVKYQDELVERRQALDTALDEARQILGADSTGTP